MITRETVGMTLLLFSIVLLVITVTGPILFGPVGLAIAAFFIGLFGFLAYPLFVLAIYLSAVLTFGAKHRLSLKPGLRAAFVLLAIYLIVHTATAERFFGNGYGAYLSGCWSAASESIGRGTGGGVLLGIVAYPVRLLSAPVAYILFSLLLVFAVWLFLLATPIGDKLRFRRSPRKASDSREPKTEGERDYPAGISFDELPRTERRPADRAAYSAYDGGYDNRGYDNRGYDNRGYDNRGYDRAPADQYGGPAAPNSPSNREILFGGDPAANYRTNLIYDRDSYFNTRERHSSVEPRYRTPANPYAPPTAGPNSSPSQPSQPAGQAGNYSEQYRDEVSRERPPMPRRVTEDRPVQPGSYPYSAPNGYDANYPQANRAPEPPAPPVPPRPEEKADTRDFFSRPTIPPAEGTESPSPFSRTPVPAPEDEPAPPAPSYRASLPPRADGPTDSYENDVTDEFSSAPNVFDDPAPFGGEQPEPDPAAERERQFRDLFSRGSDEGTRSDDFGSTGRDFGRDLGRDTTRDLGRDLGSTPRDLGRDIGRDTPRDLGRDLGSTPRDFGDLGRGIEEEGSEPFEPAIPENDDEPPRGSRVFDSPAVRGSRANLFDDDAEEDVPPEPTVPAVPDRAASRGFRGESAPSSAPAPAPRAAEEKPAPKPHVYRPFVQPDMGSLRRYEDKKPISQEEIEQNSAIIVDTLRGFRVEAEVMKVTAGPAVLRYDIDVPKNISVSAVVKRADEVAMRLCAKDGVNMYANLEHGVISIEVPKPGDKRSIVGLRSVLEADSYVNAKPNSLMFGLGKDVEGRSICGNIVKMKHLLVAGSTGSGKSVFLNAMLISLISKYSPEDLRLILIDPKKVEFAIFEGLPHLMINEIIVDSQKAVMSLNWAIKEMERRYLLFEQKGRATRNAIRDIDEYNAARDADEEKLPKIVIVFDELADFMAVAKREIEERVARLAAKARAAGIHLVLATQRPSVDVITGVIKGNLPTRIAFRVIQEVDSRTILDEMGAEKLLGNGDMLYRSEGMYNSMRVQGAFLSSEEVQTIVNEIKDRNEAYFDDTVADFINKSGEGGGGGDDEDSDDESASPEAIKALGIAVKLKQASISLIQRKCSIGYAHAGKIIEWMERMGYISPFDGSSKARTVLLTPEEYESKYGKLD